MSDQIYMAILIKTNKHLKHFHVDYIEIIVVVRDTSQVHVFHKIFVDFRYLILDFLKIFPYPVKLLLLKNLLYLQLFVKAVYE